MASTSTSKTSAPAPKKAAQQGTPRKLVAQTFVSLDGVMQAPGGPDEDREGGFKHGGWSMKYWDEGMGKLMGERMAVPHDLVLGRKTYDIFADYWPKHRDQPEAALLNNATKYVAFRSRRRLGWENSHILEGDAAKSVAQLKQQPGSPSASWAARTSCRRS